MSQDSSHRMLPVFVAKALKMEKFSHPKPAVVSTMMRKKKAMSDSYKTLLRTTPLTGSNTNHHLSKKISYSYRSMNITTTKCQAGQHKTDFLLQ